MSLSQTQCIEYLTYNCIEFTIKGVVDFESDNKYMAFRASALSFDGVSRFEIWGLTYMRALEGLVCAIKREETNMLNNVTQLSFPFKSQVADMTLDG
jgi:hypothetical protein